MRVLHASGISKDIYPGAKIQAGQHLGRTGGNGKVSKKTYGEHGHIEFYESLQQAQTNGDKFLTYDEVENNFFDKEQLIPNGTFPTDSPPLNLKEKLIKKK